MADYTVVISRTAQKQLDKLTDNLAYPLIDAIQKLATDPRPPGHKKLRGRDGYRIRKGRYRIIYDVYDDVLTVEIITLGHRRDIYR